MLQGRERAPVVGSFRCNKVEDDDVEVGGGRVGVFERQRVGERVSYHGGFLIDDFVHLDRARHIQPQRVAQGSGVLVGSHQNRVVDPIVRSVLNDHIVGVGKRAASSAKSLSTCNQVGESRVRNGRLARKDNQLNVVKLHWIRASVGTRIKENAPDAGNKRRGKSIEFRQHKGRICHARIQREKCGIGTPPVCRVAYREGLRNVVEATTITKTKERIDVDAGVSKIDTESYGAIPGSNPKSFTRHQDRPGVEPIIFSKLLIPAIENCRPDRGVGPSGWRGSCKGVFVVNIGVEGRERTSNIRQPSRDKIRYPHVGLFEQPRVVQKHDKADGISHTGRICRVHKLVNAHRRNNKGNR